jgi:3-hydroxyacyl-CoA dehydrogenase / 3-hydroxy-2-methylbutyryl-CoA dehydrogenase
MVVDVSEEKAKAVAMEIGPAKGMYAVVDVTDEAKVKASVQEITNKWGALNVAVNCAGINTQKYPIILMK